VNIHLDTLKPEKAIDFHIRWAWYGISRMYGNQAAHFGGSMSMGYALLNIDEEGIPSTKLAPKMGMEARSLTRMIKTLVDNGLIIKVQDKDDKRLVKLCLTKKGSEQRELARQSVLKFNEKIYSEIPKEDLETTFAVLTKVNELIEKNNIF